MWGRREGVSFILWAVRESCLRGVFPLSGCVWSDGVWYWGGWSFYGFACMGFRCVLIMNLGTGQRASKNIFGIPLWVWGLTGLILLLLLGPMPVKPEIWD